MVNFVNFVCVWAGGGRADFLCSRRNRQCLLASFQFVGGRVTDSTTHNRKDEGEKKLRQNNESGQN